MRGESIEPGSLTWVARVENLRVAANREEEAAEGVGGRGERERDEMMELGLGGEGRVREG